MRGVPIDTDPDPSPDPRARRLRKYWTRPGQPGAAKIGWGTKGDWRRCVAHLSKYVGAGAPGLCSVYHHEVMGFWPGDKRNKSLPAETQERIDRILVESTALDERQNTMEHKSLDAIFTKGLVQVDPEHSEITAYVSVTGIKDGVNDIIVPGAFAKSMQQRTPKGVWSHNWSVPVSKTMEMKELMPGDPELPKTLANGDPWPPAAGAVRVRTRFNTDTPEGKSAFSNVQFYDDEQEWSIGYKVAEGKATRGEGGVRLIHELNWFEYSPVLFGAMSEARSVKDAAHEQLISIKSILGDDAFDDEVSGLYSEKSRDERKGKKNSTDDDPDYEGHDFYPVEVDFDEDDDPEDNLKDEEKSLYDLYADLQRKGVDPSDLVQEMASLGNTVNYGTPADALYALDSVLTIAEKALVENSEARQELGEIVLKAQAMVEDGYDGNDEDDDVIEDDDDADLDDDSDHGGDDSDSADPESAGDSESAGEPEGKGLQGQGIKMTADDNSRFIQNL